MIGVKELDEIKSIRKQYNGIMIKVLETEWGIEIALMNEELHLSIYGDFIDNLGNIDDFVEINTDDYAKTVIITYKNNSKYTVIDEDGEIIECNDYVFKNEESERLLLAKLEQYEVVPDKKYLVNDDKIYWNDCIKKAFDYIEEKRFNELRLIHGICKMWNFGQLKEYVHAWIEFDDIVFDGVRQRFYNKEGYYNTMYAEKIAEYTVEESINNAVKYGEYIWDSRLIEMLG